MPTPAFYAEDNGRQYISITKKGGLVLDYIKNRDVGPEKIDFNKAIQIVLLNDNEFFSIEEIYNTLANYYQNMSVMQIRDSIRYALKHRNEIKCENNFQNIFGFEYDEDFFTNKKIIEELN